MALYAGLDRDGVVKLFMEERGKYFHIHHKEWLVLTEALKLQPGEMPQVSLNKRKNSCEMCEIYGSEISFHKEVPLTNIQKVCQDIWDNADKYSDYQKNGEDAYYRFLRFLWVKFPDGRDERLVDQINM